MRRPPIRSAPGKRPPTRPVAVVPRAPARFAALLLLLPLAACARADTFAQHPGFDEWFEAHPPADHPPDPAARALLRRHRPVLRVPAGHPGPLDFYRDYIAHGTLAANGHEWRPVDRERLAEHADDPGARFTHRPPSAPDPAAVAYGRVDRAPLAPFGRLTFLTWHFVFRTSGLPAELPWWQEAAARALGDVHDWHQLDHYTAATLVLGPGHEPLGLVLQQHNHLRAYWYGRDRVLPADGRPRIAAARRSNELYPWTGSAARHRVVRFLEPDNLRWLATGRGNEPWTASRDLVPDEVRRVEYALRFLPQTDPFYRFQGRLGESRLLPGRDGPPGADYNTLPALKDRRLQFCALRWTGTAGTARLERIERLLAAPDDAGARRWLLERCRAFVRQRLERADGGSARAPIRYNAAAVSQVPPMP